MFFVNLNKNYINFMHNYVIPNTLHIKHKDGSAAMYANPVARGLLNPRVTLVTHPMQTCFHPKVFSGFRSFRVEHRGFYRCCREITIFFCATYGWPLTVHRPNGRRGCARELLQGRVTSTSSTFWNRGHARRIFTFSVDGAPIRTYNKHGGGYGHGPYVFFAEIGVTRPPSGSETRPAAQRIRTCGGHLSLVPMHCSAWERGICAGRARMIV